MDRPGYALAVLFALNALNFFDRQILSAVAEPVRRELLLSDSALGALGTAFTLLYAFVGVPFGRLADRGRRTLILAGGVCAWSLLTGASGLARGFWELFVLRLAIGIGEASCAPAATSLIGDLFPAQRRARALSVFMFGLPVGLALSFALSGLMAQAWGWRAAFFVAAPPGLLCALAVLLVREPARGMAEAHAVRDRRREGQALLVVLRIPTVLWIIVSGALHNFNMYALSSFLVPLLMRYHGLDVRQAGLVSTLVYGVAGGVGLLAGGTLADRAAQRGREGRLRVCAISILGSVALMLLALAQGPGAVVAFGLLLALAVVAMYVYYGAIYAALQDVVEPALRGTALGLYFFAMYVLGASLGPFLTGALSDHFAARAAAAAGSPALEPFRAVGLHSALYVVPVLGVPLALVLFAGARVAREDARKLEAFMREAAAAP